MKSQVLELSFLSLKMIVKSGLEFILKFTEPLQVEIPASLPGQFSPTGQIFWHWAAATRLVNFKIKNSRPLFAIIFAIE